MSSMSTWHLWRHFLRVVTRPPSVFPSNILMAIALMSFVLVPRLYEFKIATWLVSRSYRFTVKLDRFDRLFCFNGFFSLLSPL